jgi:phosphogluconate dehydratase
VIKISAVAPERRFVRAPALIFHQQEEVEAAFKRGELNHDFIAVVRFQGVKAIGMPELHKLTPILASVMAHGHKVALVTDGRMSGASGKVPAAIHVTPEAADGGAIGKIRNGDIVRVDALAGTLTVSVDKAIWAERTTAPHDPTTSSSGTGRELFSVFRRAVGTADTGATIFDPIAA